MTLKIYGIPASRAIRPLWAAEELGLDYENIKIHYASDAVKAPEYLRLNPNATVPAIEDDGLSLFESLAINLYLAKKHARAGLWGDSLEVEAQLMQWTLWAATEVEPHARQWFHHTGFLPSEQRRPELAEAALGALDRRFAVLEGWLADRPYLVGERFTIADLNLAAVLQRLNDLGGARFPRVLEWHERCISRPAAKRAFALRAAA